MYTLNLKKMKKLRRKGPLRASNFEDAQPVVYWLTNHERVVWARNGYKTKGELWNEFKRRASARATGRVDTLSEVVRQRPPSRFEQQRARIFDPLATLTLAAALAEPLITSQPEKT